MDTTQQLLVRLKAFVNSSELIWHYWIADRNHI